MGGTGGGGRRAYYQTIARNICLYQELGSVLETLRGAGIPVIVLKGAALALGLYPSIGLRPMGDVDLLVPRPRLTEAVRCLKTLGYVEPIPDMAPGLNPVVGHHVSLVSNGDIPLHVEVHWTLVAGEHDRHAPSMAWFWEQTEPLSWSQGAEEQRGRGARETRRGGDGERERSHPLTLSPLHLCTNCLRLCALRRAPSGTRPWPGLRTG